MNLIVTIRDPLTKGPSTCAGWGNASPTLTGKEVPGRLWSFSPLNMLGSHSGTYESPKKALALASQWLSLLKV